MIPLTQVESPQIVDAVVFTIPTDLPARIRRFERGRDVLLVDPGEDDFSVEWVLLDCTASGITSKGEDGVWRPEPDQYTRLAHGNGPAGCLRELRHTWFTPDEGCGPGYIFYVKPKLLAWAFECLGEWFTYYGDEP